MNPGDLRSWPSLTQRRHFQQRSTWLVAALLILLGLGAACSQPAAVNETEQPVQVELITDGQTHRLTSEGATVRELLVEAGVELGDLDEVDPPLFTPLTEGLIIRVVRVLEELEITTETIPFERQFVRTDTMSADDDPQIVQPGNPGLREVTVRLLYRDGLEASRVRTNETILEEPQEEVVLIGIGANRGIVNFPGTLAYISGGAPVLMRGTTAIPEQLSTTGQLDGRVFALSPTGDQLLYTQVDSDNSNFNNRLWLLPTASGSDPVDLEVDNVLWAGWNPLITDTMQIAYTTAVSSTQPPGWEANNDLWLGNIGISGTLTMTNKRLIDAYPALNGWWGGNYAWSPVGRYLAYSFANEVGVIDTLESEAERQHVQLQRFTPFNTRADWVWVPSLTWSPDGSYVGFTQHGGADETGMQFDSWVAGLNQPIAAQFVEQTGMWGHLHWAPDNEKIAFMRATDPQDSLRSNYTLWLMDTDGSNSRQLYPAPGENSDFSRDQSFLAWGPEAERMAFIFEDDLFILDLQDESITRITQDDTVDSYPTWAPYGIEAGIKK